MSTTTWHITMSLDGFIAGPEHSMDWAFGHGDAPNSIADSVRTSTGAILAGRTWHDVAMERYDGVAFISGSIEDAIATTREGAGGRDIGVFGATTAAQVLDAGLLEEIAVHVAPVMLGDGVRLYGSPAAERVALERAELAASGQLTSMRFRVVR